VPSDFAEAFAGRTTFVTGADGFFGSHLVDRLVDAGSDVHALVRASSSGELRNVAHHVGQLTLHRANLEDPRSVRLTLRDLKRGANGPVTIFHLGAQAHVRESWDRPYETFAVNVMGTLNILQGILDEDLAVAKLDIAGTSEEYGNVDPALLQLYTFHGDRPVFNERAPLNPESPYATSKVAADFLGRNYFRAYGLPVVVTRMFNTFGPRQNPRYITGTLITQMLSRSEARLGATETHRDFLYVADTVNAHLAVAAEGRPGEVYCAGYGEQISIGDWAELIRSVGQAAGYWGDVAMTVDPARLRPGQTDLLHLQVDAGKLTSHTGWHPKVDRENGLRETIAWYAANRERWIGRVDWLS